VIPVRDADAAPRIALEEEGIGNVRYCLMAVLVVVLLKLRVGRTTGTVTHIRWSRAVAGTSGSGACALPAGRREVSFIFLVEDAATNPVNLGCGRSWTMSMPENMRVRTSGRPSGPGPCLASCGGRGGLRVTVNVVDGSAGPLPARFCGSGREPANWAYSQRLWAERAGGLSFRDSEARLRGLEGWRERIDHISKRRLLVAKTSIDIQITVAALDAKRVVS